MHNEKISSLRYTISGMLGVLMYLIPLIAVPILAYQCSNWWLLFGIPIAFIGTIVGAKKYKYLILGLVSAVFLAFNNHERFDIYKTFPFYFFCFLFGFLCMIIYTIIGLGDRTSRALISLQNKGVRKDIEKEIKEGIENYRKSENQN